MTLIDLICKANMVLNNQLMEHERQDTIHNNTRVKGNNSRIKTFLFTFYFQCRGNSTRTCQAASYEVQRSESVARLDIKKPYFITDQ